jgi:DNA polymerase I-like protein with 3'-5' exonuclease and polymerase domains|tara:strand:+ start:3805 stop:5781 length:1977 start_codon:yes stop_codon:yes gene_type:complete
MCNTPEDLDLQNVDTVAIDLETYDPNLKTKGLGAVRGDGFICGVAIATGKDTVYFPLNHTDIDKDSLDTNKFWNVLNDKLFQNEKITKVFHNAMYDVCWIRAVTGKMLKGRLVDTMIAASVLNENEMRYSLDSLSKKYLQDSKYKYDLQKKTLEWSGGMVKDPMSNMHKLPSSVVKEYAKQDVDLTLKLWNLFNKKLDEVLYTNPETNDEKTCRKIFELETKLFPCLVDMKFKGVKIDVQKATNFGKHLQKRITQIIKAIEKRTTIKVDIWAASSIKQLLNNQNITDYKKTPKSGMPQLPKDYLKTHDNKCLRMIAKAREYDKAVNTFINGLLDYVHKGRIHADINQIRSDSGGTVTGRFSMSNPNLQQIPARGYIGKKMREMFLPEENCKWASFDYSQQEPRIVVHYAIKIGLPKTEELQEEFNKQDADFHQIVADMAKISRTQAKTINLGLFYGMGKMKLQKELGLDKDKAKELFSDYHKKVPFVKQLSQELINFSKENKLLYTLHDRFCRFDRYETTDRKWNPKKGKFDEVDLLTKEQAFKEFEIEYRKVAKDCKGRDLTDKEWEYFHNYYTPAFTYKALNRLIQGSAADMTKKAMVDLYQLGIIPHIQIHDELCLSVENDYKANIVQSSMESAIPLEIKNKVNYKRGQNWGSIK